MIDTLPTRSMLFSLIVLLHGAIFWWLLFLASNVTPPVAQAMMFAMLLPNEEPQLLQKAPQVSKHIPVNDSPVRLEEPVQSQEPVREAVTPPEPAQPATFAPAIEAPPIPVVLPPRFDAAYLNNPAPAYPPAARRLGVQGKVLLRVYVSAEGAATEVKLHKSSGSFALDEAALTAVRKWRFVPARQGVEPVAAWVQVPIDFKLN